MEFIQDFMLIVTKCKTKVGVVDNDLNKLLEKDATSHKGKCLVLCVMDSLGLVNKKMKTKVYNQYDFFNMIIWNSFYR